MPLGDFVNQIPAPVFLAIHLVPGDPIRIVEFLLLNPVFPQSVRFALGAADDALVVQIWDRNGMQLYLSQPQRVLPQHAQLGFTTLACASTGNLSASVAAAAASLPSAASDGRSGHRWRPARELQR